ncbi:MAG: hypothetical protein ABL895_03060 [Cyclobacteriaceae bacterium]
MKGFITLGILLTQAVGLIAQGSYEKPDSIVGVKKFEYYFYLQSGTLIGCNECSRGKELTFTGATVHGVKIGKRLRVGAGLGYDSYYGWNTMPVFGSASWDLFAKRNAFFVQFDYGGSLKSWKYSQYDEYGYQGSEGGRMVNPMVGYRVRYHDISLALLVGYKYQRVSSTYEYPTYYWDPLRGQIMGEPNKTTMVKEMNRFMLSMSIGWK